MNLLEVNFPNNVKEKGKTLTWKKTARAPRTDEKRIHEDKWRRDFHLFITFTNNMLRNRNSAHQQNFHWIEEDFFNERSQLFFFFRFLTNWKWPTTEKGNWRSYDNRVVRQGKVQFFFPRFPFLIQKKEKEKKAMQIIIIERRRRRRRREKINGGQRVKNQGPGPTFSFNRKWFNLSFFFILKRYKKNQVNLSMKY